VRAWSATFGAREEGWVNRKHSILDAVRADALTLEKSLPVDDKARVDEHLSSIRDLERAIAGLPPQYARVDPPDFDGDMKDWPRIAKLQSDLLAQKRNHRRHRWSNRFRNSIESDEDPGRIGAGAITAGPRKAPDFRQAQARSKRSRFITLFHAATKSFTNASFESSHA
jgi:hypothetical protein